MEMLLRGSRAIDRLSLTVGKSVMWLILVAILVSAANAVVRKVFNYSSNAWLELQWYLFGAAFMLVSASTLLQNEHIRIDIFYGTRSRRTQHWIDLKTAKGQKLPAERFSAWNNISRIGVHRTEVSWEAKDLWTIIIDGDAGTGISPFDWDKGLTDEERNGHLLRHCH